MKRKESHLMVEFTRIWFSCFHELVLMMINIRPWTYLTMQPCPRFPCQPPPPSPCACQDFRLLALCGLSSLKSTNQTLSSTTPSSGATPKAPLHSLFFVQLDEVKLRQPRWVHLHILAKSVVKNESWFTVNCGVVWDSWGGVEVGVLLSFVCYECIDSSILGEGVPATARVWWDDGVQCCLGLVVVHVRKGELELPRQVMMKYLGDVSWTVMVSMYAQAKRSREPLELFREIRDVRVRPTDVVTMVSVMLLMSLLLLLSENFRFAPGVTTKPLQAPG